MVTARIQHGLPEGNDGFRPARARTPSQVHRRYIFALTCHYPVGQGTRPRCQRRADGPHTGRTAGNAGNPGWALSRRHGGVTGRTGHNRATANEPAPALTTPDAGTLRSEPDLHRNLPRLVLSTSDGRVSRRAAAVAYRCLARRNRRSMRNRPTAGNIPWHRPRRPGRNWRFTGTHRVTE